jgi:hypothetical protein
MQPSVENLHDLFIPFPTKGQFRHPEGDGLLIRMGILPFPESFFNNRKLRRNLQGSEDDLVHPLAETSGGDPSLAPDPLNRRVYHPRLLQVPQKTVNRFPQGRLRHFFLSIFLQAVPQNDRKSGREHLLRG